MRRPFVSLSALGLLTAALGCHHTAEMCCDNGASAPAPLDLSQGRDLYPWSSSGHAAEDPDRLAPGPGYPLAAPTPPQPPVPVQDPWPAPASPPAVPPAVPPAPPVQPLPDENSKEAGAIPPPPGVYHDALFPEPPPAPLLGEPKESRANSPSGDRANGFPLLKW